MQKSMKQSSKSISIKNNWRISTKWNSIISGKNHKIKKYNSKKLSKMPSSLNWKELRYNSSNKQSENKLNKFKYSNKSKSLSTKTSNKLKTRQNRSKISTNQSIKSTTNLMNWNKKSPTFKKRKKNCRMTWKHRENNKTILCKP